MLDGATVATARAGSMIRGDVTVAAGCSDSTLGEGGAGSFATGAGSTPDGCAMVAARGWATKRGRDAIITAGRSGSMLDGGATVSTAGGSADVMGCGTAPETVAFK
jgi:hypothetical protein